MMESVLGYVSGSNLEVKLAFYAGLGALLVTAALILIIAILRVRLIMEERRNDSFIAEWRPIITRVSAGEPLADIFLPSIARKDMPMFLMLWNHYHGFLKGEALENLNALIRSTGMDVVARRWIDSRSRAKRFISVIALGRLRDKTRWEDMALLASGQDPTLSLMAAGSMALIDPARSAPVIIPLIIERRDWPANKVMDILSKADQSAISGPLVSAILNADEKEVLRLVPFLFLADKSLSGPAVRTLLERSQDPEMISACLKTVDDPSMLDMARSYLDHPVWYVRAQAATVLGKIGFEEDGKRLVGMLSDREWWVRYRAAHALTEMPSMQSFDFAKLIRESADKYAGDIMSQALAEKKLA
ncbi:MAG: HEAT repeat domain-containing protein [Nitrospinae bacterium]|nr:HEAT repeat domain-containing protein [Nitrospinota bacterium]